MARRRAAEAQAPAFRDVPRLLALIRDPSTTGAALLTATDELIRADSMTYYRDVLDDDDVNHRYQAALFPPGSRVATTDGEMF